jgi:hypothetical protein
MIFDLLSIDQIAWTLVTRQQQRFSVGCFRFGDGFSRKCLILTLPRSSIGPNLTNCWRIPLLSVRMAITNKSVTKLIVLVATARINWNDGLIGMTSISLVKQMTCRPKTRSSRCCIRMPLQLERIQTRKSGWWMVDGGWGQSRLSRRRCLITHVGAVYSKLSGLQIGLLKVNMHCILPIVYRRFPREKQHAL